MQVFNLKEVSWNNSENVFKTPAIVRFLSFAAIGGAVFVFIFLILIKGIREVPVFGICAIWFIMGLLSLTKTNATLIISPGSGMYIFRKGIGSISEVQGQISDLGPISIIQRTGPRSGPRSHSGHKDIYSVGLRIPKEKIRLEIDWGPTVEKAKEVAAKYGSRFKLGVNDSPQI